MKTNLALASGIAAGFLTLIILAHFAGLNFSGSDFLLIVVLSLTTISTTVLLSDRPKGKRCSPNQQKSIDLFKVYKF